MSNPRKYATPEDLHLAEQQRLLGELTEQLVNKETEFATTGAEFARFLVAYVRRFAPLYGQLDQLESDIAGRLAAEEDTPAAHARAQEAASRAAESEEAARTAGASAASKQPDEAPRAVHEDLRDLYRDAAKLVHPDTAGSDEERIRRTPIMAALNEAYARGDADAVRNVVAAENARPEAITGEDVGAHLVRTLRKNAQVRARISELDQLQGAMETDPMWQVFAECRESWAEGDDPLAADEASLRTRIASAQAQLAALVLSGAKRSRPTAG